MKKTTIAFFTILILTLTACGTSSGANPASGSQAGSSAGELPAATQLILGTIRLEGSAQAVTAKQAADLLPLWQTMKVLMSSDTAANEEKEALVAQIQETMTAQQMQAITDMHLTRADMAGLLQQEGTASRSQSSSSQSRNSSGNSRRTFGPGGGFAGGPPDGGFTGGPGLGGQNVSAEQIATAQAARQTGNVISPALINAVIEYLQKKAGP